MYKSPIEMIQTEIEMQMEGETLKAVQRVGINVNKEELLKALQYDRGQYEKGYQDGVTDTNVGGKPVDGSNVCKHWRNTK